MEKVVMDKFLRSHWKLKELASQPNPQSTLQLGELVEGQQVALEVLLSGRPPLAQRSQKVWRATPGGSQQRMEGQIVLPPRQRPFLNPDGRKC